MPTINGSVNVPKWMMGILISILLGVVIQWGVVSKWAGTVTEALEQLDSRMERIEGNLDRMPHHSHAP